MALVTFQITVEVNTDALRAQLEAKARQAVDLGAKLVIQYNEERIANWNHPVEFVATDASDNNGPAALITCDDYIWQHVNNGFEGGDFFSDHVMVFPFEDIGSSYDAKTDGGGGDRIGPLMFTHYVGTRNIRARHMAQDVYDEHGEEILAAMIGVING